MKKIMKMSINLLLVTCLVLCVSACSAESPSDEASFIGTWTLACLHENGRDIGFGGSTGVWTFNKNGKAIYSVKDSSYFNDIHAKWKRQKDGTYIIKDYHKYFSVTGYDGNSNDAVFFIGEDGRLYMQLRQSGEGSYLYEVYTKDDKD